MAVVSQEAGERRPPRAPSDDDRLHMAYADPLTAAAVKPIARPPGHDEVSLPLVALERLLERGGRLVGFPA